MGNNSNENIENLETQVVVIGGGGAGMAAAVAAAEQGAEVILLEKHRNPGGNTAAALDIFACESPVHKRLNIDAPKDRYFDIAMGFSHWSINPRIIRAFVEKSGDTIRWLEEKGLSFTLNARKFTLFGQELPSTGHDPVGTDGAGIISALMDHAQKLNVRVFCDTAAKALAYSQDGKHIEVTAIRKREEEIRIKARSVIIATGGYGGNKEMMRKYCSYYNDNISLKGFPNMGDGINMAIDMGAATEGLGILQLESKGTPRQPKQIWLTSWRPMTLWVNKRGQRFTDESIDNVFEASNPVLRQPESISYTVFDETIKEHIVKLLDETVMPHYRERDREKGVKRWLPKPEIIADEDLDTLLKSAADMGDVKITDSLEEMARWMGADPGIFKATIDEYNDFCAKGHDDLFAKDPEYLMPLNTPPYYAIKCGLCILGTIGGIKIDHNMQVLDHNDKPIPGLFAAGIDTGGWEIDTYNQFLMGTTMSFAFNSGRISGENAASYSHEKFE